MNKLIVVIWLAYALLALAIPTALFVIIMHFVFKYW